MNPRTSQPDQVPLDGPPAGGEGVHRQAPMKFLYASGSRPLEGYTIKRGVGRGGFGEVYFASSDAGKEVALKLIRRNLDVELRGVRHCLNLKHPNLIGLYDIRTDDLDDQWVVMEYVTGESLDQAIDRHPEGMPVEEALWWFRGIAAGVAHLHDNGIVHRDLKPGNIFLDRASGEPGTVKIGDYGLSKFISCSRRSGQTESVGTVHYMAPEIANGRYGREVDTYALGVILYEMLTGHVPFEGESVGEVLMKHLTAEPDLASVEQPYREIIRRAMAKDPDVRISSVAELVRMLPSDAGAAPVDGMPTRPAHAQAAYAAPPNDPPRHPHVRRRQLKPRPRADEEPIYRAVMDGWNHFWDRWHSSDLPPLAKGLVIVSALVLLVISIGAWLPVLATLAGAYVVYYLVWLVLIKPGVVSHAERTAPEWKRASARVDGMTEPYPSPENRAPRPAPRRQRRLNWREQARRQLRERPLRERVTELLGSMLLSGVLCVLISLVATLMIAGESQDMLALHVWLSIVSILGCWGVLFTSALTEGYAEDQTPMRALLLAVGAIVGLAAFGLSSNLSFDLPVARDFGPGPNDTLFGEFIDPNNGLRAQFNGGAVTPSLIMSLAYFATLFVLMRWWRLAEFTRDKRLSLWSVAGCVLVAWLLHLFWWYPQPVGLAVAGIIATAVQLSSRWLPPSKRVELAKASVAV